MKAVYIEDYGGPEAMRFGDHPVPLVGPRDVAVAVHAASINPIDWKMRNGIVRQHFQLSFPAILGRDFSGVVTAVGDEVRDVAAGSEVMGMADPKRGGSHAEMIVVDRELIAPKPRGLDHVQAASLPLAGVTALVALEQVAGLAAGQQVLIHAAAGGVGGFAVQFAKHRGAWVAGTCSGVNLDYVRSLGADQALDYGRQDFTKVLAGLDIVFDTMGGAVNGRSGAVLRPGGTLVQIAAAPVTDPPSRADISVKPAVVRPTRALLERITELVEAGAVHPQVGTVLPLAEARRGYEQSRSGHQRGKIVLRVV